MGEQNKRDGRKDQSSSSAGNHPARANGRKSGANASKSSARLSGSNVGRVLRTAYDDALREAVPDEFLNLLGKLD